MNILYRQARKKDCQRIADLDYLASSGVAEYLFHDLIPNTSPAQFLTSSLEDEFDPYSYRNTIVAEYHGEVVGISISYPAKYHEITAKMRDLLPPERLDHFQHFFSTRVDESYYIDGLCVDEKYRSNGIGSQLIELTKAHARKMGYSTLSLLVFADNIKAEMLYARCGFKKVNNIHLDSHHLIPHKGGCILMAAKT